MLPWDYCRAVYLHMRPFSFRLWLNLAIPMIISRFLPKMHDVTYLLLQNFSALHTIRKVKFLSKNSILTKPQKFHEFFTQFFFDNFSREIKVVNS